MTSWITDDSDSEYEMQVESAFEYFFGDNNIIPGAYSELTRQVANKQGMAANTAKDLDYYLSRGWEKSSSRLQKRKEK